jgi:hypothetical protein
MSRGLLGGHIMEFFEGTEDNRGKAIQESRSVNTGLNPSHPEYET